MTNSNEHFDPFLSQKAVQISAHDYHDGLLERLNDLARGLPYETASLVKTVEWTARDKSHVRAFNLASEALNNAYFFSRLTTNEADTRLDIASHLQKQINSDHGSLSELQHKFSSAALGMSGSGYLWLVMDHSAARDRRAITTLPDHSTETRIGIIGTYGSGTVLVQERLQRGGVEDLGLGSTEEADPALPEPEVLNMEMTQERQTSPLANSGPRPTADSPILSQSIFQQPDTLRLQKSFEGENPNNRNLQSPSSQQAQKIAAVNTSLNVKKLQITPLLCLSIHERSWMPDYGVNGKEEYLRNFWSVVNWKKVADSFLALGGRVSHFGNETVRVGDSNALKGTAYEGVGRSPRKPSSAALDQVTPL